MCMYILMICIRLEMENFVVFVVYYIVFVLLVYNFKGTLSWRKGCINFLGKSYSQIAKVFLTERARPGRRVVGWIGF